MGEYVDIQVEMPSVNGWLNVLNQYAQSAISNANSVAGSLSNFTPPTYTPTIKMGTVGTSFNMNAASKPTVPSLSMGTRSLPSATSVNVPTVTIDAAPSFTESDPSVNIPNAPDPLAISLPVKAFTIDTSTSFPVSPSTTLPDVPTLLSLDLPSLSTISLPTFTVDFPTSNAIAIPGVTFSFTENVYNSELSTKVKSELLRRLNGGTGLNPIVEQAIWDRGKDRESKAAVLAERALLVDRASQGFSRPTGSALAALEGVVQESQGKIIELSREVMIKQAELEQANLKDAIQQTIALEDIYIRESLAINQRSFEVAKYIQDIAVDLFKVQLAKYNSEVEAYKAFSVAYESKVKAELSKVEIFKAQIDAQKLKGDINEQNIRIYLARLEGIKSNVEVYKTLISAVSEKLRAEGLKLDVYKTDVEAYSTAVKAKAEEYSMYSERIKGELAKVSVFDSKVKAYTSRIQAYASKADVQLKQAEVSSKVEELKLKKYTADIEAFIKQVQADQLVYQSAVDLYKGETQMYLAETSVNKSSAELAIKSAEATIQQNKYLADVSLANANITLESVKAAYNSVLDARKSAGSIYSQIGSSALSAIHVSANVSETAGLSVSESFNHNL